MSELHFISREKIVHKGTDLFWSYHYDALRAEKKYLVESLSLDLNEEFDIFLSHSSNDKALIGRLLHEFKDKKIYVDWVNDNGTHRDDIALKLLQRMQNSKSLIFVYTSNSDLSYWCSWEIGYFSGIKPKAIAILAVGEHEKDFNKKEFLKLYPSYNPLDNNISYPDNYRRNMKINENKASLDSVLKG